MSQYKIKEEELSVLKIEQDMASVAHTEHQINDFNKSIYSNIKKIDDEDDRSTIKYEKIDYHWFYTKNMQDKVIWMPFSDKDSKNLDNFYVQNRYFCNYVVKNNVL
jgi:hypothetical protein